MANDFRVDTDALEAVAERVKRLKEDLSGANGYYSGSKAQFDEASPDAISEALGAQTSDPMDGSGDGTSAFARSYSGEHTGLNFTYQSLIDQLGALYNACHGTAETYKDHEGGARQAVTASGEA